MTSLVLGATGFVGKGLVTELRARGLEVRTASRRAGTGVTCELERAETLPPALAGIDVVYFLVHSLGRADFREVDRRCALNLLTAAAASGCQRIVYLGGVAPRGIPSEHLASRLEVGEILRSGPVPTIELRASMIIGTGSASWRIVRDLAARLPFMVLPRWLESRTCPIALSDVVTALVDASEVAVPQSAWFDIPGPDILRVREMIEIVAALDGRRIPAVRIPLLTPALSAMWLKLVSGVDYALARELVLGLTEDLLPQASFWEHSANAPRLSFRVAAANALAEEAPRSSLVRGLERAVHRLGRHTP